MLANVGRSASKRGRMFAPCVPNREWITSDTFIKYWSSVSTCRGTGHRGLGQSGSGQGGLGQSGLGQGGLGQGGLG